MNSKFFMAFLLLCLSLMAYSQGNGNTDTVPGINVSEAEDYRDKAVYDLQQSILKLYNEVNELKMLLQSKTSFDDIEQISQRTQDDILEATMVLIDKNTEEITNEITGLIRSSNSLLISELEQMVNQKDSNLNDGIMEVINNMQVIIIDQAKDLIDKNNQELIINIGDRIEFENMELNKLIEEQSEAVLKIEGRIQELEEK
jgi:hypothetical protein